MARKAWHPTIWEQMGRTISSMKIRLGFLLMTPLHQDRSTSSIVISTWTAGNLPVKLIGPETTSMEASVGSMRWILVQIRERSIQVQWLTTKQMDLQRWCILAKIWSMSYREVMMAWMTIPRRRKDYSLWGIQGNEKNNMQMFLTIIMMI